jgi:adenylate cyclase
VANVGLALLLAALFGLLYRSSRKSIIDAAQDVLTAQSNLSADKVGNYLRQAERPIVDLERQWRHAVGDAHDPAVVETQLLAELLNDPDLAEVTFTHAASTGWNEAGAMQTEPASRWQVSVYRDTPEVDSPILARYTYRRRDDFVAEMRPAHGHAAPTASRARPAPIEAADPTAHLTFTTIVRQDLYGHLTWSDLSYSQIDERLPEPQRRVVVTVMRSMGDETGRFAGVVRVGLRTDSVDAIVRTIEAEAREQAPMRLFLCDPDGRFVTPVTAEAHRREEADASLRYVSPDLPREIASALRQPALPQLKLGGTNVSAHARFEDGGRSFLVAFRALREKEKDSVEELAQGWRAGVLVAEDELPAVQRLRASSHRLLAEALAMMLLVLAGGIVVLRIVQGGLGTIVTSTAHMRDFDFSPSSRSSPLADVASAIGSLELAKTALRAMSKYVPTDLVRLLYRTGREPVLGGELAVVTMMFTDIESFTSLSERLSPDALARVLGRYLEVMTTAIHRRQGTIDKYIGDAVMAVWNTPSPCPDHARTACEAALDCVQAASDLFASPEWKGMPLLVTRFGLHTGEVMVGHFGAPDRMSFTCLGDGVNLASRLEGLNKQYGTTLIVSDAVREQAGDAFVYRLLDVVAVKGKTKGVRVYELLGRSGLSGPYVDAARRYEQAFDAYERRDFRGALSLVGAQTDGPSTVLAERCRRLIENPPAPDWDGTYVASSK